jgi:hypothetical protein
MTCVALLEPCFGSFLISNVFKEFMEYVIVALQVSGVFKENGPYNPVVRHCALHSDLDRVKRSFMRF